MNALVTRRSIPIEQCMDPDNRHVFAGYAIAVGDLADFLGDVSRADHRLPRALQEAERDDSEVRHVSEPGRATQHMGDSITGCVLAWLRQLSVAPSSRVVA